MADISIDAGASSLQARCGRSLVFTDASTGYFFFIDADGDYKYSKTTDGGQTWNSPVTIFTGFVLAADVWFDKWTSGDSGTLIHTWYVNSGANDVLYRPLDTATDTLGTQTTVSSTGTPGDSFGTWISGAKMRGGNLLVVFWTDPQDAGIAGTRRSTDSGASWGTRTSLAENDGNDKALMFPGNEADNQDGWCLYLDSSANAITLKVHDDSADTNAESSTIVSITDSTTDGTAQSPFGGAVRHSDGHLIFAVWTELDSATGDFRVFDVNGTGSISELTAIATNQDDCYYPAVTIDQNNQDIYVAYIGKTDGSETLGTSASVYYRKSINNGTSWGIDIVYSATGSDWRQTYVPHSGPRFMVAWRDVSSSAINTNYDNSVVFSTGTTYDETATGGVVVTRNSYLAISDSFDRANGAVGSSDGDGHIDAGFTLLGINAGGGIAYTTAGSPTIVSNLLDLNISGTVDAAFAAVAPSAHLYVRANRINGNAVFHVYFYTSASLLTSSSFRFELSWNGEFNSLFVDDVQVATQGGYEDGNADVFFDYNGQTLRGKWGAQAQLSHTIAGRQIYGIRIRNNGSSVTPYRFDNLFVYVDGTNTQTYNETVAGGDLTAGSGTIQCVYSAVDSGGALCSGQAVTNIAINGAGGARCAGTAIPVGSQTSKGTGGAWSGGQAIIVFSDFCAEDCGREATICCYTCVEDNCCSEGKEMKYVFPDDKKKKFKKNEGAFVPAITVCLQRLS